MDIGIYYDYIKDLEKGLEKGISAEPSYYPYLKALIESIEKGINATKEPNKALQATLGPNGIVAARMCDLTCTLLHCSINNDA